MERERCVRGSSMSLLPLMYPGGPLDNAEEKAFMPSTPIWLPPSPRYWRDASDPLASLQRLLLSHNQIGDEGMKAFSSALSSGSLASLETLGLLNNQIGDEGMKAFSSALSSGATG